MDNKVSKSVDNLNRAGRPKGTPNKTTATARQAFATLVEGSAPKMEEWLYSVANGIQDEDTGKWIVSPDPKGALDLLTKIAEYHVPKLARTEHIGDSEKPIKYVVTWKK
jgi:hypothetical protein